ncbi:hypothetical protein Y1Q_0002381 [Alligator mississippiensis]|uniref:Uncharacterized protein n=1 Tax=Alligator mississippiensis TaxID=8496 RepID=A0A151MGX3_ALLMI|nr:hypothetical protein Y1Q_0002381 [Alligator mississippiensis]
MWQGPCTAQSTASSLTLWHQPEGFAVWSSDEHLGSFKREAISSMCWETVKATYTEHCGSRSETSAFFSGKIKACSA